MEQGTNEHVNIKDELEAAFLDYSMSVIVSRALPDIRDGLKPVHRRILFTLNDLNLRPNRPFRKCAKITGDVSGNYHPHGDQVIYPSLARLAQDFSMRYPLIHGQGNFGSVDGDPPAAQRYTEAKMRRITEEMLKDINKATVDFTPNYDGTREEPTVLPSAFPNLLVNGSSGIAVGMATNIPPHNLGEIIDGLELLVSNPELSIDELIEVIHGPDFPTGGFIHGREGIFSMYKSGRGRILMRARAMIEKEKRTGRERIIISEIPYMLNKTSLIEKMADEVKTKRIEGISDIRDESDREGMRIVVELKRDGEARVILNQLFKYTQMESTFGAIMLALVNGQPKVCNLKEMLQYYIDHRVEVVTRRTQYELDQSEKRAHILEGLKIALDRIDEVIKLIRASRTANEAKSGLIERFGLSPVQSQAILDMRLHRLTGLEREKIEEEYRELLKEIERLRSILENRALLMSVVMGELREIREKYADDRRTEIIDAEGEINFEDLIVEEEMVVFITHGGYAKRNSLSLYRAQKRRGQGVTGIIAKEDDFVEHLFVTSTHNYILVFTNMGKVYWLKVYKVPQAGRAAKGRALVNMLDISREEKVTAILPTRDFPEDRYIMMVTSNGIVKKTALSAYGNPRANGIIALKLDDDDELISVSQTDGTQDVFLATYLGQAIRFHESDARPIGRTARGVIGIRLRENDRVVGMETLRPGTAVLTVTERAYGKRTVIEEYKAQKRGGQGLINIRTTRRNGNVVGIARVVDGDELMLITVQGKIIRVRIDEESMRKIGRSTQGVRIQAMSDDDIVAAVAHLVSED